MPELRSGAYTDDFGRLVNVFDIYWGTPASKVSADGKVGLLYPYDRNVEGE